jgi:hypothetical protein
MFLRLARGMPRWRVIEVGGAESLFVEGKRNKPDEGETDMLEWLEFTPLALWVKESWGWPFALTMHAFGSAVIVGFSFIMCLRLLGMFRTIPLVSLSSLVPIVLVCVGVQAFSGFLLWLTKPGIYLNAGVFGVKLALVVAGFIATVHFHKALKQEAGRWDSSGTISAQGIRYIAITASVWAAVLIAGRLTAYLGIYVTAVEH